MDEHQHDEVIEGVKEQFKELLDESSQAIYIYLDDDHKICNSKFASLLGYSSPDEWAGVTGPFPENFVAESSQQHLVDTYMDAMEKKIGSKVEITWKKKDGEEVKSKVILVPISYNNEFLALHFIEEIN